jgi:hypothetical protein
MLKRAFKIITIFEILKSPLHNKLKSHFIHSIDFCFFDMSHPISQSFKHIRLTHYKITVYMHEFCRWDKKCEQNSKVHCLLAIHNFDLIFSFLES